MFTNVIKIVCKHALICLQTIFVALSNKQTSIEGSAVYSICCVFYLLLGFPCIIIDKMTINDELRTLYQHKAVVKCVAKRTCEWLKEKQHKRYTVFQRRFCSYVRIQFLMWFSWGCSLVLVWMLPSVTTNHIPSCMSVCPVERAQKQPPHHISVNMRGE